MPIGVPKVPFRLPGEPAAQWVDLYNRLYRERESDKLKDDHVLIPTQPDVFKEDKNIEDQQGKLYTRLIPSLSDTVTQSEIDNRNRNVQAVLITLAFTLGIVGLSYLSFVFFESFKKIGDAPSNPVNKEKSKTRMMMKKLMNFLFLSALLLLHQKSYSGLMLFQLILHLPIKEEMKIGFRCGIFSPL